MTHIALAAAGTLALASAALGSSPAYADTHAACVPLQQTQADVSPDGKSLNVPSIESMTVTVDSGCRLGLRAELANRPDGLVAGDYLRAWVDVDDNQASGLSDDDQRIVGADKLVTLNATGAMPIVARVSKPNPGPITATAGKWIAEGEVASDAGRGFKTELPVRPGHVSFLVEVGRNLQAEGWTVTDKFATSPEPPPGQPYGPAPAVDVVRDTSVSLPTDGPQQLPALVQGLPPTATKICTSRRRITIHLHPAAKPKLASVKVYVAGKLKAKRAGSKLTLPVSLKGLPKGRYTIKLVLVPKSGKAQTLTRRYRTCAPKARRAIRRATSRVRHPRERTTRGS